jgi:PAS domain S-box-containing protein
MTLRGRLALLYGALSSLALAIALAAAYGFYERAAYRNVDGLLSVFALLGDNPNTRASESPYSFLPAVLPISLRAVNADGVTIRTGGQPTRLPSVKPLFTGGVAAHAPWVGWLPTVASPHDVSRFGLVQFEGQRWRVYNQPSTNGETLQVIASLAATDAAVARVRSNYAVFGTLGALFVALLGYAISAPALRPVAELTDLAQTVARARDPQFRLPNFSGRDELGRLGATFNAMLESLDGAAQARESAFSRERAARLEAEQVGDALTISEARFRRVVESRVIGVLILGADGELAYANRALLDMIGAVTLEGKHWRDLFKRTTALEAQPSENELQRADGSTLPVLVSATALEGGSGETAVFILDISDRQRLERAQARFVADAAHELRAPLTAIQGNLELLERYPDMDADARQETVSEAAHGARRLARLAQDLLTLARGDAGPDLELHPLSFDALVAEVVQGARHQAHHHTLSFEPAPGVRVNGHADRLRQLVTVLVDNALKYTPVGGVVTVRLEANADAATLCVTDTGPGIAPSDLERVFERFYRAHSAPGGTGLGLAIARKITEQHGGTIWLESEVGQGTKAFVRLPRIAQRHV